MHDKFILMTVDIVLSGISIITLITFGGIIPMIASILSIGWFVNLFKKHIEDNHKGSLKKWFLWYIDFLKKN